MKAGLAGGLKAKCFALIHIEVFASSSFKDTIKLVYEHFNAYV